MLAQTAISSSEIIITEQDFDRLQALRDSPRFRAKQSSLLMALSDELNRGTVVAANAVPRGVVTMHSKVRVRDTKSSECDTYTLVYPDEADINENKLSVLAPLGMALLGTRIGQVVKFDAPAGRRRLKIERIIYQPESSGDFHL